MFQVSQLPFPFTSHDEWEHSVRVPLGKDWNTTSVHQKLVKPRIVTLPGTIIEPIKSTKCLQHNGGAKHTEKAGKGRKRNAWEMKSGLKIHN